MPLGFSFPFGRRRNSQGAEKSPQKSRSSSKTGSNGRRATATAVPTDASNTFRIIVPSDARPGESIRVRAPDGRLVEIDLPPTCRPGKTITIEIEPIPMHGSSVDGPLKELHTVVKTNFDSIRATCASLRDRLKEELELQRGLWASSASSHQAVLPCREWQLSLASSEELSQTQVLVVAAAEDGDCKQLLAALSEAKRFHAVSSSLGECCQSLNSAEEAMVIWQCLLDALHVGNRHEISVWAEEAQALGLVVPDGLSNALLELQRREEDSLKQFERSKEVEQKLKFAMECGDTDVMKSAISEAASLGVHSQLVNQAKAHLQSQTRSASSQQQTPQPSRPPPNINANSNRNSSSEAGPEAGAGPNPTQRTSASYNYTPQGTDVGKSVRELLEEARLLGIETRGCTDRDDLQRLIDNSKRKAPDPQPAPQGFVTQMPAPQVRNPAADSGTVWSRRIPPPHLMTKRGKAVHLLGLDPSKTFTQAEIRSAYRKAAMECHPDRQQNHARQEQAKEVFQQVKEAFDFLCSS